MAMGPSEVERALDVDLGDLLGEALTGFAAARGVDARALARGLADGASLAQALDFSPSATESLYARAHRWFSLGRPDRAESCFRALCLLDDRRADFWVGFGVCLRLRAAFDEALRAFATAARLRPDWAIPHFHALEAHLRRGEWEHAAIELAKFRARINDGTQPAMIAEAVRYKTAIEMRTAPPLDEIAVRGDNEGVHP
jgi:tetratricopeptide (TPR) repeat protein